MYYEGDGDAAVGSVEAIGGMLSLLVALGAGGSNKEQATPIVFRTASATVVELAGVF